MTGPVEQREHEARSYEDQLRDALSRGDADDVRRLRRIAQAITDRRSGAMPTEVRKREDADELWAAFRRTRCAWTGQQVDDFVAGWDAREVAS